jgi:endonuclease YncB( thermonuclease family)
MRAAFARTQSPFRSVGFLALGTLAVGILVYHHDYLPADLGSHRTPPTSLSNVITIDGDSLRSGGKDYRLLGIDAPELNQICRDERGRNWACGHEAHAHLRAFVGRGAVNCVFNSRDRYNRELGRCSAQDVADLGEAMVRAGYAVDFMNGGYRSAEAEARREKRGIWRGEFERPADYRKRQSRAATR